MLWYQMLRNGLLFDQIVLRAVLTSIESLFLYTLPASSIMIQFPLKFLLYIQWLGWSMENHPKVSSTVSQVWCVVASSCWKMKSSCSVSVNRLTCFSLYFISTCCWKIFALKHLAGVEETWSAHNKAGSVWSKRLFVKTKIVL